MSSTSRNVRQLIAWFVSLLPICFYVALAIVCGLHRRWISVAFSVASAFAFSVSEVLNRIAIISAMVVARHRPNAAQPLNGMPRKTRQGAASPCVDLHTGLSTTDGSGNLMTAQRSEEVGVVSSMAESESTMANANAFAVGSSSSRQVETCFRASTNPLHLARHAARAVCAARQESSQSPVEFLAMDLEETCILSPPFSLVDVCKKNAVSGICASSTMGQCSCKSYPTERLAVEGNGSSFDGQMAISQKDHAQRAPLFSPRLPDPKRSPTDAQPAFSPVTILHLRFADSSTSLCTALTMLVVSLYVTITLSMLTLAGSFVLEYDTHCLFLACPALGVPWLWTHLVLVKDALHNTPEVLRSFHGRLVRVLTHWLFMLAIWVVSLGVFVAAFTLEIVRWAPYSIGGEATPGAIRAVSYLAPVQMMVFIGVIFNNLMEMRGISIEEDEGSVVVTNKVVAAADFRGCLLAQQVPSALAPPHVVPDRRDQPLSVAGEEGRFACAPATHGAGAVPATPVSPSAQFRILSANFMPTLSDDTCSTLSSIVRSSTGSSIFIPRILSSSCEMLPVNMSRRHDSHSSSNGGSGHPSSSQPTAIMTSVPQLKTVTILYVAYRDIYEDEDAMTSAFTASDERGGIVANREKQQTVSANFESMMEALEDAREKGSADANAYVLTAYEDAICLVWGLIPFSSEPVLLAIEKARQIMDAFKSRPRPPTRFSSAQQELVAAVVSAPHSLVGLIGSGSYRGIHFFNARQHALGAQILRRGLAMYHRLPSQQASLGEQENPFHCILLDGRSWNSTASHILARPCGLHCSKELGANAKRESRCRIPLDVSSKSTVRQFSVMYSFLEVVHAKEEEWHLLVQRQEHLGSKFHFLSEAVQQLHQGNLNDARQVLKDAVQSTSSTGDADNIALAHMLLEDLDRAEDGVPRNT
ncbi:hypothetical protein GH5_02191 [Leishmania sp. Ghana 2012 LV757]|uniref:hypothetical protein n=1 Tax=Leishmania sp. Ghana 2012 LV757 TaxID=2803181 RepID=UPI001B439F9A|nr:hypothetical protein GH5_02191 [Leishmania sp. Ghana 2012 LV757]